LINVTTSNNTTNASENGCYDGYKWKGILIYVLGTAVGVCVGAVFGMIV